MNVEEQDILIITITILSIITLLCLTCQYFSLRNRISDIRLIVDLDRPGQIEKYKNNYFISLSHHRTTPPVPPSPTVLYESLTERPELKAPEPSAPVPLPSLITNTPPISDLSEREAEEESFIPSVDDQEETGGNKEDITELKATCEVLKDRTIKLERELRKLRK